MGEYDGGTTAVIAYVRRHVTPKMLWATIGILVSALVSVLYVSITWIVTMQSDVKSIKDWQPETKKTMADMQQNIAKLQTDQAVTESMVKGMDAEVKRQGGKWDRVEEVADSPPHARRRH
jgi:mannitol-specific phosphotransferase system IIBC component